jgi:hypothetical protein
MDDDLDWKAEILGKNRVDAGADQVDSVVVGDTDRAHGLGNF